MSVMFRQCYVRVLTRFLHHCHTAMTRSPYRCESFILYVCFYEGEIP